MNLTQEDKMFVEFYTDPVHMVAESEVQGRPIYKEFEHIKIVIPGDQSNIIERRATDEDKKKYPNAWLRFQNSVKSGFDGTPLEQWPQINRAQVKECKHVDIHTVEHMSALSDALCAKMGPGFTDLRAKAKAYLMAANETAAVTAQAAENERMKARIEDLEAQIREIGKRGPGRPPKDQTEA